MHHAPATSARRSLKSRLTRWGGTLLLGTAAAFGTVACGEDTGELEILRVDPQAGAIQGQQRITIQGRNFRPDIGYTVYFGAQRATKVSMVDPQTLQVETPSVPEPVTVDIVVRADDGPAFRIAEGFRYVDMGGNVMEQVGAGPERQEGDSNLAY